MGCCNALKTFPGEKLGLAEGTRALLHRVGDGWNLSSLGLHFHEAMLSPAYLPSRPVGLRPTGVLLLA